MPSEESRTIPLASSQAPRSNQHTSDLTVPFDSFGEPAMHTGPSTMRVNFALDPTVLAAPPASDWLEIESNEQKKLRAKFDDNHF